MKNDPSKLSVYDSYWDKALELTREVLTRRGVSPDRAARLTGKLSTRRKLQLQIRRDALRISSAAA